MKKIAMIFLLAFFQAAGLEAAELFQGTLEIRGELPLMRRCGLTKDEYVLVDQEGSSTEYLAQMRKLGVDSGEKLQARIVGELRRVGARQALAVESIEEVSPGSCQLDSQFSERPGEQ